MSLRFTMFIVSILLIAYLCYWMNNNIYMYGVAIKDPDKMMYSWDVKLRGWDILYKSPVIFIPGIIVGLITSLLLTTRAYLKAESLDHQSEIENLKGIAEAAKKRANDAEYRADERVKNAIQEAENRRIKADQEIERSNSIRIEAATLMERARNEIRHYQIENQRLEKKKNNAMHAAERIKKKNSIQKPY